MTTPILFFIQWIFFPFCCFSLLFIYSFIFPGLLFLGKDEIEKRLNGDCDLEIERNRLKIQSFKFRAFYVTVQGRDTGTFQKIEPKKKIIKILQSLCFLRFHCRLSDYFPRPGIALWLKHRTQDWNLFDYFAYFLL